MTVAELIEKLREFPPDAPVWGWGGHEAEPCEPEPTWENYSGDPGPGVYL